MKKLLSTLVLLLGLEALAQLPSPNTSSVQLAWNAVPNAGVTNYTVFQGTISGSYPTNFSGGTNLTFTASNLVRGTTYYWAVTATANGVTSPYSSEVSYLVLSTAAPTGPHIIVITP